MQVTVTLQNDVKSSSPTSHEPSRLVTLFRKRSLFSPRVGVGVGWGNLVVFMITLSLSPPHPKALYYSCDSPPFPLAVNWRSISEVPLLHSVGEN